MSTATLTPQPDEEDQSHSQTQVPPQIQTSSSSSASSMAMLVIAMVVKLITFACLLVSTILLPTNSVTIRGFDTDASFHFNDIYSYRYALATAVIGLAYTLLQLPFSIHRVMTSGKPLPHHAKLLTFDFFGDKVVVGLVGTGVGAAFGATLDLKTQLDALEDAYLARTELDDFFSRAYFPAIFLLIAFLTCGASSVLSSLALLNKTQ